MSDILTITLQPAVDLATSVERVVAGSKLYCKTPRVDPGGGGVNVARAICKLGGRATAMAVVGGVRGTELLDLLAAENVPTHPFHVSAETRFSLAVTDESNGQQFRFSLPGDRMDPKTGNRLLTEIVGATPQRGFLVLSGGVAPGLGDDFPQQVQNATSVITDRLIVDTSKAPLDRLIAKPIAPPLLMLRVDQKETTKAAGHAMDKMEDSLSFASALVARGVARMVVSGRGADGSVLVTENSRYFCRSEPVPVLSTVGAGDSFVGAMTLALSRGDPPEQALRWGVAAASATVGTEGTALCEAAYTRTLFESCTLVAL